MVNINYFMKIKQIRVSNSVLPFKEKMISKYNLLDYYEKNEPSIDLTAIQSARSAF